MTSDRACGRSCACDDCTVRVLADLRRALASVPPADRATLLLAALDEQRHGPAAVQAVSPPDSTSP